ncbi:tRNA-specific adenosine deaminase [Novacetimonas maltaceti]|nr:nucleoside deaminase [Novacetimonas maltaceti]PYD60218.1 tRNA-specific adenosine deaminase [Novacetimonas maltaceti]
MPPRRTRDPMSLAFAEARAAALRGEVPVGAVVVGPGGIVLARAGNRTEELHDPSAHAEMLALREAVRVRGGRRLADCALYVTLEPCPMCAGAAVHFRIGRILFGAYDPKGGGVDHGPRLFARPGCLHRPETIGGLREQEAQAMLRAFFGDRRTP